MGEHDNPLISGCLQGRNRSSFLAAAPWTSALLILYTFFVQGISGKTTYLVDGIAWRGFGPRVTGEQIGAGLKRFRAAPGISARVKAST